MKRETLYAVKLKHGLAINDEAGPAVFYRKKEAVNFKRRLAPHFKDVKIKVVRVVLETEP